MNLPSLTARKLCRLTVAQHKLSFLWNARILDRQVFINAWAMFHSWWLQNAMPGGNLAVFLVIAQLSHNRGGGRITETIGDRVSIFGRAYFG